MSIPGAKEGSAGRNLPVLGEKLILLPKYKGLKATILGPPSSRLGPRQRAVLLLLLSGFETSLEGAIGL